MSALLRRLVSWVSAFALALAPVAVSANPQNGQVVGGAASIAGQGTHNVVVDQSTNRAIINWGSFNIAPNETTQFVQPNASSVILNRVTGGLGVSEIDGMIKANGGVYVVNPDGILIGPSGQINVGSFLATTHDIANQVQHYGALDKTPSDQVQNVRNDMYLVSEAIRVLGKDKDSDYTELGDLIRARVRNVYTIGSAAEKIERQLEGTVKIVSAGTLDAAVRAAAKGASAGDVVLLAPACSSFDQFENYEHRGRVFKELVGELGASAG